MFESVLHSLGLEGSNHGVRGLGVVEASSPVEVDSINPATGRPIARVRMGSVEDYERVAAAVAARRSSRGGWSRLRSGARSSARSGRPSARRSGTWACSSPWRRARSAPRGRARSRR